jgi:hypothetical protein
MGVLNYGSSGQHPIELDDRALVHLQMVVSSKLRLRQSFFFSWLESVDGGGGRGSIWIDAAIPISFTYASSQRYKVNREWLDALMISANSVNGLQLTPEPREPPSTTDPIHLIERSWSSASDLIRS